MDMFRTPGSIGRGLIGLQGYQVFHRPAVGEGGLACWIAQPSLPRAVPPLVAVHGISRNALEMVHLLTPLAERLGCSVIVPCFVKRGWRNYQQVVKPRRADLALLHLLQDVMAEGFCDTSSFALFGYSGGSQFCHRFAMLYPHRVARLVLGAAGWYTMPRSDLAFPLGIGVRERKKTPEKTGPDDWGPYFERGLRRFVRLPIDVVVGEHDNISDSATRRSPRLDSVQGTNRLARAASWVLSVQQVAEHLGEESDVRLHVLPGCRHSVKQCVLRGGLLDLIAAAYGPAPEWAQPGDLGARGASPQISESEPFHFA